MDDHPAIILRVVLCNLLARELVLRLLFLPFVIHDSGRSGVHTIDLKQWEGR